MYQCTARSDAGEAEHGQRLNVHGPPFVREMKNVSVLAAETMTLICPAGGWPIDSITWEKGEPQKNEESVQRGMIVTEQFENRLLNT